MAIENPLSPITEVSEPDSHRSDDEVKQQVPPTRPTTPQFPRLASLQQALQEALPVQRPGHLYASQFARPAFNYSAQYYGLNEPGSINSNPPHSSVSQRSSSLNSNNLTNPSSTPSGSTSLNGSALPNNTARPTIHPDDAPLPDYITHPNRSGPPPPYTTRPSRTALSNGRAPPLANPIHPDDAPLPTSITHPNGPARPPTYTRHPNVFAPLHPDDAPLPDYITPPSHSARLPAYSPHPNDSRPPPYSGLSLSSITHRQFVATPYNSPQLGPATFAENQTRAPLNPRVLEPLRPAPPPPRPGRSAPGIPGPGISPRADLPRAFGPPPAPRLAFATPVARPLIVRTSSARQPAQRPNVDDDDDDMEEDMTSRTRRRGGGKPVKRQGSSKKKGDSKRVKTEKKKEEAWNDPEKVLGDGNCETYQDRTNISAIINHPTAKEVLRSRDLSGKFTPSDMSNFKQDGKLGWHNPAYLSEAAAASGKRADSEFAELEKERFKEEWGEEEEEYSD